MFDLDFLYTREDIRPKGDTIVQTKVPRGYEFDSILEPYIDPFPWLTKRLDIRANGEEERIQRGYEFDGILLNNSESDFPWLDANEDIRRSPIQAEEQMSVERGHEFDYIMENYLKSIAEAAEADDGIYYPGLKEYTFGAR